MIKTISQVLQEHKTWREQTFLIEDDTITLFPGEIDYWISWNRIDTKEKLLGWIHHLSAKRWITPAAICELINIVSGKYGLDIRCP